LTSGHLCSYEETEKACDIIENLFGQDFFKKGVEIIKDSDPSGSGMGRQYSKNSASRLLLAWYKAREELTYSSIQGFFRPGIYSAVIGSLGKDLFNLRGIPGIETTAAGLLDDCSFERTVFILSVASGFKHISDQVFFSHDLTGHFATGGDYTIHCISPYTSGPLKENFSPQDVYREIIESVANGNNYDGKKILYYNITDPGCSLQSVGGIIHNHPTLILIKHDIMAIILCKIEFSLTTGGICRKISAYPIINNETSGNESAEGLNIYVP